MYLSHDKIFSLEGLLARVASWKVHSNPIVFTNGCFDLLHLGHIDYLEKARLLGKRLIVGLNSDASVGQLKGAKRPINNQESRARMLAAFEFVDAVVLFEEETPIRLIEAISPDVLVKGGDYQIADIVGHEWVRQNGGKVMTIPFLEGYSSSELIMKIQKM